MLNSIDHLLFIHSRITWLAISGLPPQIWSSESFTSIAKLWGDVLIPEECNSRQFNRVIEIDGVSDSFFNGYLLNPSDDDNTTLGDLHGWHDDDVNDDENVEFSGKKDNGSDNNPDNEDEKDVNVIASDGFPNLDKSNGPRIPATSPETYSDDGSTSAALVVKDKDYTNANANFFWLHTLEINITR
ncbi:hypothetical protein Tco_0864337 [Tanacetum coccineum]